MINTAYEWAEILVFALLMVITCLVIIVLSAVMGCGYVLKALLTLDFNAIIE